jgi:aminoglycoside 2'-N-acetyltransferase I
VPPRAGAGGAAEGEVAQCGEPAVVEGVAWEPRMTELRTVHTADLDAGTRSAIRALLDAAFGGVGDDTFENVLGGLHALLAEDGELVGHASVVQRRLLYDGRPLRTGYIEGVAVREDRRRRGHGAAMMSVLERVVRSGYQLGALGASAEGGRLYAARGWRLWRGPSSALTPEGIRRTAGNDGSIYVLPVSVPLDVSGELVCDWRHGALW